MGYISQYLSLQQMYKKSPFFISNDGWASNFVLPKAEKLLDAWVHLVEVLSESVWFAYQHNFAVT